MHADVDGRGPRLVLVHGFAQNRNCWGSMATELATDHEVVRVDAPGHGRSPEAAADLATGARQIAECGGEGTYIGYSMGARYVLHVALERPDVVRGVVLVGGTAGIDDDAARVERRALDDERARQLEHSGLDQFLDAWLAQPLFAGLGPEAAFRDERRENTVAGLAGSLRRAGTGAQEPLWNRLGRLAMPVLAVAGAVDAKFSAEARRMVAAIGANATLALVPEAGHAAHLERPHEFLAILRPWLAHREL